eukprot:TRINITY_DN4006_c0_g1_i4.p3 TRINITY_DN4006_c0_g1~~TRINITY_DN4006_c0_g1_i4.p3  ORF type:complete len:244 (-),score=98.10 TRINITY_DN4006_c0_g1_i4:212-871(-)
MCIRDSNNIIPNVHLRKHWGGFVKTWFNQPANKRRRLERRQARAAATYPRPLERLRPVVRCTTIRYNTRQRLGRGFTLEEIRKAGLTPRFARSVGIAVDHRRKNKNVEAFQQNVQRLNDYKARLVLFPRKTGQAKKGLINDTAADPKTAQVTQNTGRVVVPVPVRKLREKAVTLTKDLKDKRVYRILRQERTNAKWVGIREKRAKQAEKKQNQQFVSII